MSAPKHDSNGVEYVCEGCSLHLHAYTGRTDKRDQYSSRGASGVLVGVGNVGKHLGDYKESKTFLSIDAGRTWTEIVGRHFMNEFSVSAALFVLVNDGRCSKQARTCDVK